MEMEQVKQFLRDMAFNVVEGDMIMQIGDYEHREPIIGVKTSPQHQCVDPDCGRFHLIGTKTALAYMSEQALRRMIDEELAFNR